jgi:hypothetical protein
MKRFINLAVLALAIVLGSSLQQSASAQYYEDRGDVTYQTFYDELISHGRWIEYPEYGYVWIPYAGPDFRPYSTNGHWVWTDDYEWMWVSDFDWGWAPFHYGRWFEDDYYGWVWVPGYEWSPAWVAWRDGGDYYGWAPLRPGVNISVNFNIGSYNPPYNYWCFVPRRYITSPRIYDYYLDRSQNVTIINYTTIINNYYYGDRYGFRSGPRRYDAERYCGRITPVRFRDSYSPGRTFYRNNEISFYRPQVRRDDNRNFSPRQFDRYERREGSFRSNNSGFRRTENENNRGNNNQSVRREFDRREGYTYRQPQENNQRNFERNNNNTRRYYPAERNDRNNYQQPGNNGNERRFERINNENRNYNTPVRQPGDREFNNGAYQRPTERRQEVNQQQQNNRSFERRDNNGTRGNRPRGRF